MDKIALSLNIIKNDNDSHMYAFIIMLTDVIADIMPSIFTVLWACCWFTLGKRIGSSERLRDDVMI